MNSTFATFFAVLFVAHQLGDHFVQTQHQADNKGLPGWRGRLACASHVATYTVLAVILLAVVAWRTGLDLHWPAVALGLAVSAISHYIADRRRPLRWLADRLRKSPAWLDNGGGMYQLDQAWHYGWLLIAALIMM